MVKSKTLGPVIIAGIPQQPMAEMFEVQYSQQRVKSFVAVLWSLPNAKVVGSEDLLPELSKLD